MRLYTCDGDGYVFEVDQSGDFSDCLSVKIFDPRGVELDTKETVEAILSMTDVNRLIALLKAGKMYVESVD